VVSEDAVKRLALLVLAGAAAVATGAQSAGATNECRGLQVCVRVAGPWVVVPAGLGTPRTRVEYQLSCPRSFAVGGLDAELTDRALDVDFLGKLGSPVGPGVTTSRSAVFGALYTGASARAPSFRPHLGCIPLTGGGTGPVPYRVSATFPPGEPTIRRVRTVRLRPGILHATAACTAGERLISGWHAVGFYTASPPGASLIQSVSAARVLRGNRVEVRLRVGTAIRGVRAVIQVGAVCGGGS
jgi:hypothetical protein